MADNASAEPVPRWYEAFNTKDMAVADETVHPEVVVHWSAAPDTVGLAAYKQTAAFWTAFDDLSLTVERVVAEGDIVVMRSRLRGRFTGPFMGVPPTQGEVSWLYHDIYRVRDGSGSRCGSSPTASP